MSRIIITTLLFTVTLLTSCAPDPLTELNQRVSDWDYQGALSLIAELPPELLDDEQVVKIHVKALLVEGRSDEAFQILNERPLTEPERAEFGGILLESGNVIMREINRAREAAVLLDSARSFDPGLTRDVTQALWYRSIEYFQIAGDGGFILFNLASRIDPNIRGRLRGYNLIFNKRYEEMKAVDQQLGKLSLKINLFQDSRNRLPRNWFELLRAGMVISRDTLRNGWEIKTPESGDSLLTARIRKGNPWGIPLGTEMRRPVTPPKP